MKFNLNQDSINYIKIAYKDADDSSYSIKAAVKSIGEREITACTKFEDGLYIKTPRDINLSIICETGLYKTTTTLKYIENVPPYTVFYLETPQGLDYQQNREYFRVKLCEDVIMSYMQDNNIVRIPLKSYDISANGIRLQVDKTIQGLDEVSLDILFSPKNVKVRAKLIRIDDEDNIKKASFKFLNIQESDMDIISQICIQKQLEYKRNNAR